MKVIIKYPDDSWILSRLGETLLQIEGCYRHIDNPDLVYYCNWHLGRNVLKFDTPIGGYFTHMENDEFLKVGARMNFCVGMCSMTSDILRKVNKNTFTVFPPVDRIFKPKLAVGFSGRFYSSQRKGDHLLEKVKQLPFVDLKVTGGTLPYENLPSFYQSLDCVLITSTVEGGPMCLLESLACGVPVITTNVGLVPDVIKNTSNDIIVYKTANELYTILYARYIEKQIIASSVKEFTTENYLKQHLEIFLKMRGKNV